MEDIPKQPPNGCKKKPENNGISTTFTSTGEFTGFLNHQQYKDATSIEQTLPS